MRYSESPRCQVVRVGRKGPRVERNARRLACNVRGVARKAWEVRAWEFPGWGKLMGLGCRVNGQDAGAAGIVPDTLSNLAPFPI
jgi:hypothetical protein